MIRHFTVSAFVSAQGHTLLHFHQKNQMWLPPAATSSPMKTPTKPARASLNERHEE